MISYKKVLLYGLLALAPFYIGRQHIEVRQGIGSTYQTSYENGIAYIHELAKTSKTEDQWVYSENEWQDIGKDEDKFSVRQDFSKVKDSLIRKKSVMVHIHPDENDDKFYPPSMPDLEIYAKYKSEFSDYSNTELKAQTVDKDGLWTYDLSEETETLLKGRGFENCRVNRPRISLKWKIMDLEKLTIIGNRKLDDAIKDYIKEAEKLGIYLTYKSFD